MGRGGRGGGARDRLAAQGSVSKPEIDLGGRTLPIVLRRLRHAKTPDPAACARWRRRCASPCRPGPKAARRSPLPMPAPVGSKPSLPACRSAPRRCRGAKVHYRGAALRLEWQSRAPPPPDGGRRGAARGRAEAGLESRIRRWLEAEALRLSQADMQDYCAAGRAGPGAPSVSPARNGAGARVRTRPASGSTGGWSRHPTSSADRFVAPRSRTSRPFRSQPGLPRAAGSASTKPTSRSPIAGCANMAAGFTPLSGRRAALCVRSERSLYYPHAVKIALTTSVPRPWPISGTKSAPPALSLADPWRLSVMPVAGNPINWAHGDDGLTRIPNDPGSPISPPSIRTGPRPKSSRPTGPIRK